MPISSSRWGVQLLFCKENADTVKQLYQLLSKATSVCGKKTIAELFADFNIHSTKLYSPEGDSNWLGILGEFLLNSEESKEDILSLIGCSFILDVDLREQSTMLSLYLEGKSPKNFLTALQSALPIITNVTVERFY